MADPKKKSKEFVLDQTLTIESIKEIRKKFDAMIQKAESLIVKAADIQVIDLTGIQLFYYIRSVCKKKDVSLSFDVHFSDEQEALLRKCGFEDLLS